MASANGNKQNLSENRLKTIFESISHHIERIEYMAKQIEHERRELIALFDELETL